MEQLKVIGTEEGILVLATESGERFALPVDETLRAQLRTARPSSEPRAARPSPREIQGHIRSGMSAQDVASLLGVRVEDVTRYERPIIAEREHIVGQALAVPVLMAGELEPDAQPTFGTAVRTKLTEAGASGERWTSWRETDGWVVKVEFSVGDIAHDARWSFDPRRSSLAPLNADATQLSRQGSLPEGLIPRLRALDTPLVKDDSRFDSGAFGPRHPAAAVVDAPVAPHENRTSAPSAAQDAAIKRAPEPVVTSAETADLLEALRRRRGQREPMPAEERAESRERTPVSLFDALAPVDEAQPETRDETPTAPVAPVDDEPSAATEDAHAADSRRKGRTSMPSWDEIVFGARSEDA